MKGLKPSDLFEPNKYKIPIGGWFNDLNIKNFCFFAFAYIYHAKYRENSDIMMH